MTGKQAQAEAFRRWGNNCALRYPTQGHFYRVGLMTSLSPGITSEIVVLGEGRSWQAAFDDADQRKGVPIARQPIPIRDTPETTEQDVERRR